MSSVAPGFHRRVGRWLSFLPPEKLLPSQAVRKENSILCADTRVEVFTASK